MLTHIELSVLAGKQGPTRGSLPSHPHLERQRLPPLATRVHSHEARARQRHVHDRQLGDHFGACSGRGVVLGVQHRPNAEFVEAKCVPGFVGGSSECSKLHCRDLGGGAHRKDLRLEFFNRFVRLYSNNNGQLSRATGHLGWMIIYGCWML